MYMYCTHSPVSWKSLLPWYWQFDNLLLWLQYTDYTHGLRQLLLIVLFSNVNKYLLWWELNDFMVSTRHTSGFLYNEDHYHKYTAYSDTITGWLYLYWVSNSQDNKASSCLYDYFLLISDNELSWQFIGCHYGVTIIQVIVIPMTSITPVLAQTP